MGTCSSSAKNWGCVVARRRLLESFNYLPACTHPGCILSCQGVLNRLASSLHLFLVEASPMREKAVSCYKMDQLVASLPSFRSVYRLQYVNFVLQPKNAANEAIDWYV